MTERVREPRILSLHILNIPANWGQGSAWDRFGCSKYRDSYDAQVIASVQGATAEDIVDSQDTITNSDLAYRTGWVHDGNTFDAILQNTRRANPAVGTDGYPDLDLVPPDQIVDSDNDGMDDAWENLWVTILGLNSIEEFDPEDDFDRDGYLNIEHYIFNEKTP